MLKNLEKYYKGYIKLFFERTFKLTQNLILQLSKTEYFRLSAMTLIC